MEKDKDLDIEKRSLLFSLDFIVKYIEFARKNPEEKNKLENLTIVDRQNNLSHKLVLNSSGDVCYEFSDKEVIHLKLVLGLDMSRFILSNEAFLILKNYSEKIEIQNKGADIKVLNVQQRMNLAVQNVFNSIEQSRNIKDRDSTAIVLVKKEKKVIGEEMFFPIDPKAYDEENAQNTFYEITGKIFELKAACKNTDYTRILVRGEIPSSKEFVDTLIYFLDSTHFKYRLTNAQGGIRKVFVYWDIN